MTQTLQWIRESKLFANFEKIFEHDDQGVKIKNKRSYHHIVSTKDKKHLKNTKILIGGGGTQLFVNFYFWGGGGWEPNPCDKG
jgi:hypothetical protein